MRTIITIDDKEAADFFALCQAKGWSRAKGFREGARLLMKQDMPIKKVDAFGIWKSRAIDGVTYQQRLRDEWS